MTVRAGLLLRAALAGAIAAAAFMLPGVFASAQQIDMNVVDQPGYVPSPDEEQLSGVYEKQEVFFRTSEAPGTIVIDTSQRFLYLVQPNNRALRYGMESGATASSGRACRRFRASRNGPTGARRRR